MTYSFRAEYELLLPFNVQSALFPLFLSSFAVIYMFISTIYNLSELNESMKPESDAS